MFDVDRVDALIDAWRDFVDMKNPYQFGNDVIDMERFQSVLKQTYDDICELKGGFIRGQSNAGAIFRFAELISVMAQYIPDTCTDDESEECVFTVTCLLTGALIFFATHGDDFVLDGETIATDGKNCPHKIFYLSDDIDGCLVYDFETGDYSDFSDYAKFIC